MEPGRAASPLEEILEEGVRQWGQPFLEMRVEELGEFLEGVEKLFWLFII